MEDEILAGKWPSSYYSVISLNWKYKNGHRRMPENRAYTGCPRWNNVEASNLNTKQNEEVPFFLFFVLFFFFCKSSYHVRITSQNGYFWILLSHRQIGAQKIPHPRSGLRDLIGKPTQTRISVSNFHINAAFSTFSGDKKLRKTIFPRGTTFQLSFKILRKNIQFCGRYRSVEFAVAGLTFTIDDARCNFFFYMVVPSCI